MRTAKAIRRDSAAVSPVIATILMVAITVVLAAVLYVMVTGLIQNPGQTPQQIGVNVTGDLAGGTLWKMSISNAPSQPLASDVTLVLTLADGSSVSGTLASPPANVTWNDVIDDGDTGTPATVDAGDYVAVEKSVYASGTGYQLIVGGSVAASGTLR